MSKQAEHHAIAIVWILRNPLRDDPLPRRLRELVADRNTNPRSRRAGVEKTTEQGDGVGKSAAEAGGVPPEASTATSAGVPSTSSRRIDNLTELPPELEAKSQASLIAAILDRQPPAMSSLRPMTPPAQDRVVERCLAKDRDDRWQSARDVCEELKWIAESGSQATATADRVAPAKGIHTLSGRPLALVLALLLVGAAISGFVVWNLKPSPPQPVAPTVISPPPAQQLAGMVAAPNVDGMSNFAVQEEFCGGMAVEGGIGKLGWFTDFGIGSSISRDSTSAPDVNHPCSLTFNSGHNIGGHAVTFLMFCADSTASQDCKNYGSINVFPALGTIPFDSTFILKPTTSTNVGWAVGFFDWNNGNPCGGGNGTPTEGLCVRYRTDLDSSIIFQACRSGTCTNTASGVVPTAGDWIKIRIRSVTGGTILYSFCQSVPPNGCTLGAETSIGTNVPQNAMTPVIGTKFITRADFPQRVPQLAAASVAAVNYFSISIPVSR